MAHRFGFPRKDQKVPRAIVARFGDGDKRSLALSFRDKLRRDPNFKNTFISVHLPEDLQEQKRQSEFFFGYNDKLPAANKSNLSFRQGTLMHNGKPFEQAFKPPDLLHLAAIPNNTYNIISEMDPGPPIQERAASGNVFTAYAVPVASSQEVRDIYTHLRIHSPSATHISAAYVLPGLGLSKIGLADDGEYRAGRAIIKPILAKEIRGVSVFVIRCAGRRLGGARFRIINNLVERQMKRLHPDAFGN